MGDDGCYRHKSLPPGPRPIPRHEMPQRRRSLLGMWRKMGKTEAEISALIDERIASKTKVW